MVHSSRINFDHPYYDDVDEYYLGLCNETEYEKEASNPREKEFGDSFKLLTSAERYDQFLKTQTSRFFVPKKRRGSGGLGFTSMKTQTSRVFIPKKRRGSGGLGFTSMKTQTSRVFVPRKRRGSGGLTQTSRVFVPRKRRGSGGLGFTSMKTQTSKVFVPRKRRGSGGLGFTSMKTQTSKVFVPRKRRGSGGLGFTSMKTQTSKVFVPRKRRGSGGLGFTSMKTQCTDQKAKSTTGSIDESGSPLGAILVPEKRRASRHKFVRKNNHCIMSTDQEDDLTAKMKSNQEKKTAGRKRVLKSQRVDVDDDRRQRSSKKMGRRVDFKKLGLYPPPDFSSDIKSVINHQEGRDSEIKLRIMKQIFKTDMDKHQERFSMPLNQIKDGHDFLNETEMEEVRHGESMSTEVELVELGLKDGNVHQSTMKLRRWRMKNNVSYVLTSSWNDVLDRNAGALKVDDIVQVYSFRRDQKLWLALIKVRDAE